MMPRSVVVRPPAATWSRSISGLIGTPRTPLETVWSGNAPVVHFWIVSRSIGGALAAAVLSICLLAGCFGGSPSPEATVPTVSPSAVVDPASVVTTAAVRSAYELGLDTPEAAAKNLWDAWRDDDRERALMAADNAAVTTLFSDNWGPEVAEQGCVPVVPDSVYRCAFVQGAAARVVEVRSVGGRYRAIRVERIGDLATSAGPLVANRPGPVGGPTTTLKPRPVVRTRTSQPVRNAESTVAGQSATTKPARATSKKKRTPTTAPDASPDPAPVPVQARAAESTVA
jgi:hypothetical protein